MHSEPTYLAARMVAPELEAHFADYRAAALGRGAQQLPPTPSAALIEAVIDIAFWASLRREEGRPPRISLTLLGPADTAQPLLFGHPLRLTPDNLTKLAPAVEHPGIHLGVSYEPADGSLYVWGTVSEVPPVGFVLEVVEPGLLVVKHRRADGFGKFVNVAVLRGDLVKLVDEHNAGLAEMPELRDSLPPDPDPTAPVVVLVELGRVMRTHGRGALVLLVPPGSDAWQASLVQPLSYPIEPAYQGVAELLAAPVAHGPDWSAELLRHIEIIGGFTAVDGATVLTRGRLALLAFGAKVARRDGSTPVEEMVLTEPVLGSTPQRMHPAKLGGTRHLAAAQFVHDQHDGVALVASQDGNFTVFRWSKALGVVHAHRIDVLLV
ncbi:hypothetical protein HHL22_15225 [Hymenobacter sp. RP-2-7]|uniref:Probable sensor domain-containing protein n=1 Tax=Hymenobacter polaris TaxID=2682546 RepID=A0A7Y0AFT3_9BACT|nr:hypothetical protein [Hymenobacter polaris]NML66559.1 hypothetical protein [Hymenobacter polaris]